MYATVNTDSYVFQSSKLPTKSVWLFKQTERQHSKFLYIKIFYNVTKKIASNNQLYRCVHYRTTHSITNFLTMSFNTYKDKIVYKSIKRDFLKSIVLRMHLWLDLWTVGIGQMLHKFEYWYIDIMHIFCMFSLLFLYRSVWDGQKMGSCHFNQSMDAAIGTKCVWCSSQTSAQRGMGFVEGQGQCKMSSIILN